MHSLHQYVGAPTRHHSSTSGSLLDVICRGPSTRGVPRTMWSFRRVFRRQGALSETGCLWDGRWLDWWSNGSAVSGSCSRWSGLCGIGPTLNRWRQEDTRYGQFQASPPVWMLFRRRCSSHARIFLRHSSPNWLLCRSVTVIFPSRFKIASVTPLLKKPGLDSEVPGNFRPISNLKNISKILERLFLRNIIDHVSSSPSFNSNQSAYRKDHSTETALLRFLNDIYCAADKKSRSLLILLDLSAAAFDTLDICTLIRRLEHTFGIVGPALNWIKSYLTKRSQFVSSGR